MRMPMMMIRALPLITLSSVYDFLMFHFCNIAMSLFTIADAKNAISRLQEVFEADLVTETIITDHSLHNAVEVKNASFTWEVPAEAAAEIEKVPEIRDTETKLGPPMKKKEEKKGKDKAGKKDGNKDDTPAKKTETEKKVFAIKDISLTVPRGSLTAITGPVACGKTSLLQGLIGEMRRTSPKESVKFGGSVAYCSQTAWIQNASIRENVCFGRPFEEARYRKAVKDACLEMDLETLPNGDLTEVGEKVRFVSDCRVEIGAYALSSRGFLSLAVRSKESTSLGPSTPTAI